MLRRAFVVSFVASVIAGSALFACSGETTESAVANAPSDSMVNGELLALSWPMVTADEAVLATYSSQPGWLSLVTEGKIRDAVEQLGPTGGLSAARAHAEAAAMYKQASLLSATSAQATYEGSPRDTDARGTAHLNMIGHALNGDIAGAKALAEAGVDDLSPGAQAFHDVWKMALMADPAGTPTAEALTAVVNLPPVAVGQWPEISTAVHYTLAEQAEGSELNITDPSALMALALWHDAAADLASPESVDALDVFGARYRFLSEPVPTAEADLPMELVFGSDILVPADGPFLAALTGGAGISAVDTWKDRSLLAALADASRVEGALSVDAAQDAAAQARADVLAGMSEAAGGNTMGHHRVFADIVMVGVLRAMALVAEAEGNHEAAGILLISAMERSGSEYTADPEALLFLSVWDARNRYPVRGTEILHNLIRRYPNLEAARFGLDALTLRESRARGSQNPGL
ncbi:MAG: hypothetical protein ACJAZO_000609 [Myxococcota bacterium]|jgi:hypothetical protein